MRAIKISCMNKDQLVRQVAGKLNKHNNEVKDVIETIFDSIMAALGRDESVDIVGFGSFEVRERQARSGRNPRTGEQMQLKSSRAAAFRPGKRLKEVVRG